MIEIRVLLPDTSVSAMPLSEYVKGVLPAEIPSHWPEQAMIAMAWAITSYAAWHIERPRYSAQGADVCTTAATMAFAPEKRTSFSDLIADKAGNYVVSYNHALALTVFHSCCGGGTRNNEDVWNSSPVEYLRSVACPCNLADVALNGHGVGMCQWGAYTMAGLGATAHEIIQHYYRGCAVSRLEGLK